MPFLIQGHITILQRIIRYNNLDTSFDSVGERIKRSIIGTAHIVCNDCFKVREFVNRQSDIGF